MTDRLYNASAEIILTGAGPIGLELAVALKQAGADYLHLEARQIGYTISWWPRNTSFFSTTERIEIAGIPAPSTTQGRLTGEEYLAYLRSVVEQFDLPIETYEPVVKIEACNPGFAITTNPLTGKRTYFGNKLILATGDMHSPNFLHIPGEDLPHVSHYFHDPHEYFRKRLLIVGGRNSAVEAALRCWRAGSQVTLSYRKPEFNVEIVKDWILPDLLTQIENGNIGFLPQTIPIEITPDHVTLERIALDGEPTGKYITHPTDFVLLATGFTADMSLFEQAGVSLIGEQRTPQYDPETMQTNIPGLFVAGTAAAGTQKRYKLFIENCHIHVSRIVTALTGEKPKQVGAVKSRSYDLPFEEIQAN